MDSFISGERNSEAETENLVKAGSSVSRDILINRLNYLNFQGRDVISVFKHRLYESEISIRLDTMPCMKDRLSCSWKDPLPAQYNLNDYKFDHLQLDDGMCTISVVPESYTLNNDGISVVLPEKGVELTSRHIRRHQCSGIRVQMIQNGIGFKGNLKSFSPEAFSVDLDDSFKQNLHLLNRNEPMVVTMISSTCIVFSGEVMIVRGLNSEINTELVLTPLKSSIQRFKPNSERFARAVVVPSPSLVFRHPLTGQVEDLPIFDLSGSGFSVEEERQMSTLLPGMIINTAEIVFSSNLKITCKVQILYRKILEETKHGSVLRIGLCFLDMSPGDHTQLMSILFQTQNRNLYLGREIDSDAFWQFIFETGFIYPEKYFRLSKNRESVRKIYTKLYSDSPQVFKYITYQEKGRILGHIGMLRVYERSWLLHHHASSIAHSRNAGVSVMVMIADYAYSAHRIASLHLDFLMLYYRPENKFPAKVFGGYRKTLKNPKGCSEDDFAYKEITHKRDLFFDESEGMIFSEPTNKDLVTLGGFYNSVSGGLMLEAMDLLPSSSFNKDVVEAYKKDGLTRDLKIVSLKSGGELLAVFLVDKADTGINMSDLSNSLKVFVINSRKLSKELLESALNEMVGKYYGESANALVFPASYADKCGLSYEKTYRLWTTGFNFTDKYFKYIRGLLRKGNSNG